MNWVDFLIVSVTAILVLLILFYKFVLPQIRKKKGEKNASCCSEGRNAGKRLVDLYHHEKRKEEKKKAKEAEKSAKKDKE